MKMGSKGFWAKIKSWFSKEESGVIPIETSKDDQAENESQKQENNTLVVKKKDALERQQESFNQLIEKLEGINDNLTRQNAQHENMLKTFEQLPELLEKSSSAVENQARLTEEIFNTLKLSETKNQQLLEVLSEMPGQSESLKQMSDKLSVIADTDSQMADGFNKFNQTLDSLNQSAQGQTESIQKMNKTFSTSDRYLKYLITQQNRRFMWMFLTALGFCLFTILVLIGIIFYLN